MVTQREFCPRVGDGMPCVSPMCIWSPSSKQRQTITYGPVSAIQLGLIHFVSSSLYCSAVCSGSELCFRFVLLIMLPYQFPCTRVWSNKTRNKLRAWQLLSSRKGTAILRNAGNCLHGESWAIPLRGPAMLQFSRSFLIFSIICLVEDKHFRRRTTFIANTMCR
jgi:hypothetical protein